MGILVVRCAERQEMLWEKVPIRAGIFSKIVLVCPVMHVERNKVCLTAGDLEEKSNHSTVA